MKRFKNILYILDGTTLGQESSVDKVATLARLNDAHVSTMITGESTLFDDFSLKISGRYAEIKQAIVRENTESLKRFLQHERWNGIDIGPEYSEANGFISIIQKVMRDKHDLVIKEENLDQGIDQLTMRLVRKCPCPVWVIKRGSGDFRRILAAIDAGAVNPEAKALNQKIIELTHSLAQRESGEAHYLHAWRLEHEATFNSPRFKVSQDEIDEMKKQIKKDRFEQLEYLLDRNHIPHTGANTHLIEGGSEEVIKQSIVDLKIDVVVMGSVARSGIPGLLIGNKAEKTLNMINCTVLTIKPDGFVSPVTVS